MDTKTDLFIWNVSNRCGSGCKFCSRSALEHKGVFDTKYTSAVLKYIDALSPRQVSLEGNHPEIPMLVEECAKLCPTSIQCSPEFYSEELYQQLQGSLKSIIFSVDSLSAAQHEGARDGDSHFDRLMHKIDLARQYQLPISILCPLHVGNVGEIEAIVQYAVRNQFRLVSFLYTTTFGTNGFAGSLSPEQWAEAVEIIREVKARLHGETYVVYEPVFEHIAKEQLQCVCAKGSQVALTPEGDLLDCSLFFSCNSAAKHSYGNIMSGSFEEVIKKYQVHRHATSTYEACPLLNALPHSEVPYSGLRCYAHWEGF